MLLAIALGFQWGNLSVDTASYDADGFLAYRLTIKRGRKTLLSLRDVPQVMSVDTPDLDADGSPELVLETFTGGAHCCFVYLILKAQGNSITNMGMIDGGSEGLNFADLDGDGKAEAVVANPAFEYFSCDGVDIAYVYHASVQTIYRIKGGKFVEATREFPDVAQESANEILQELKRGSGTEEIEFESLLALGVAFLAEYSILGKPQEGLRILRDVAPNVAELLEGCLDEIGKRTRESSVRYDYDFYGG